MDSKLLDKAQDYINEAEALGRRGDNRAWIFVGLAFAQALVALFRTAVDGGPHKMPWEA